MPIIFHFNMFKYQPFLTAKANFLYKKMKKQQKNLKDIKTITLTLLILLLMAFLAFQAFVITPSKVEGGMVVYTSN